MIRSAVEALLKTHDYINIPNTFGDWVGDPVLGDDVELIHITESGMTLCCLFEQSKFELNIFYQRHRRRSYLSALPICSYTFINLPMDLLRTNLPVEVTMTTKLSL